MRRSLLPVLLVGGIVSAIAPGASAQSGPTDVARDVEPVVLTGADLPAWSGLPAQGVANPDPPNPPADGTFRDAHNGTLFAPPETGAPVDDIAAYRWNGTAFEEIPVQVDEMFPYFLANEPSDFAWYSNTDEELTYEWDLEGWNMTAGECSRAHPEGEGTMQDPVRTLDNDDEITFMASDAGGLAPPDAPGPIGSAATRQQVTITDPATQAVSFVYLFQKPGGSSFDASNGYVDYQRDANADQWIDRNTFRDGEPENLGSSNTGYGPNLSGTVCTDDPDTPEIETLRQTNDRFARDGVTVTTDAYRWRATGRWMVREMQVAKADQSGVYGPDLIDRWKGRAFQQNPDSSISLVGFEDEQVNWEANSILLGELEGPVRAIREVWGADSGTNVTKTETFYRDAITYRYRVRVHPIPPDGLYTSWDYNRGVTATYYNSLNPEGVAIDGVNDEEIAQTQVDQIPVQGDPAYFDAPDPTHSGVSAIENWEQIAGADDNGSLVYIWELSGATSLANAVAVPYYRDDACFDDGTGDNPVPRPWPGEASTDPRVRAGYAEAAGQPVEEIKCEEHETQGAFASHGLHAFVTHDSDNAFQSKPTTEIDIRQWQFAVPTDAPTENVGAAYGNTVIAPLQITTAAITAPNEENTPPEAAEVSGETGPSAPTTLTLSATDEHHCNLDFEIVDEPEHGTLGEIEQAECRSGSPNQDTATVTYTPSGSFGGNDSFTYRVSDAQDGVDEATGTVAVKDVSAADQGGTVQVAPVPGPGPGGKIGGQPVAVKKLCSGLSGSEHVVGTAGRDILIGTRRADVICGLDGRDFLRGGGGNDLLIGGAGRDKAMGGKGSDACRAEQRRSCERRKA